MEEIRVGDIVMCVEYPGNPCGIVVKQYRPTACGQQTMIKCNDGRLFHAPTSDFRKMQCVDKDRYEYCVECPEYEEE